MRKSNLISKKFIIRTIACAMTVVVAGASTYGYTTFANPEDVSTEETQTDVNSDDKSELEDAIDNVISVSEKEIGKDETVYVIADNTGKATSTIVSDHLKNAAGEDVIVDKSDLKDIKNVNGDETFTKDGENIKWEAKGNDIYYQGTTEKETPVNVKITYYLDGKEMTADEIAGKSGKVTVRFDYTNYEKVKADINGAEEEIYVPFIAVSGMILNDDFQNVDVKNGKVISDGKNQIVVGMAMPGMKDNLDLSDDEVEIPDYVEMTADVENFSLDMTMTVALCNEGFDISDIDLSDLDEKVDEIDDAAGKLQDGSSDLAEGLDTLNNNMPEFKSGMVTLKNGIATYTGGVSQVSSGINTLYKSSGKLVKGMKSVKKAVDAIYTNFGTKENSKTIRGGAKALADGSKTLNEGVNKLSTGADTLATGSNTVSTNMETLSNGVTTIAGQVSILNTSMTDLKNGALKVSAGVDEVADTINGLGNTIAEQEKGIYTKLAKAGVKSYDEADKALKDAKKLQTAILTAIAADTYTGLDAYGVTDAKSAAKVLTKTTENVNSLSEAVASLKVMDEVADNVSAKKEDLKELQDGAKELATGAGKAATGVNTLDTTMTSVASSTKQLAAGAKSVSEGASQIKSGLSSVVSGSSDLKDGAKSLDSGFETLYEKAISPLYTGVGTLNDSMPTLKSGVKKLKTGSDKLVANNDTLNKGAKQLNEATTTVSDGVSKLDDGANELKDGMKEFNDEAIQKLISSYNGDVKKLVNRINATSRAAQDYTTFTKTADGVNSNVKFIIKTDGVSADK